MKRGLVVLGILSLLGLALGARQVLPQGAGVPRPDAVESSPLPPPGPRSQPEGSGSGATLTQEPAPATPQTAPRGPAAPSVAARPTLVPNAGDPMEVDEVTVPGKPVAVLSGTSTWSEGFANLKGGLVRIEDELRRAGLAPAGRPLAVFVEADDMGFRYDAMVPIAQVPAGQSGLTPEIRFGRTPEGKAYRFVHKGPYEEIDGTYDTITTYLDAKGIIAKDAFIEEYVTDLTAPEDGNAEVNIFVQPR